MSVYYELWVYVQYKYMSRKILLYLNDRMTAYAVLYA